MQHETQSNNLSFRLDPWNRTKQPSYSQNEPQDRWSRPSPPRRESPPRHIMRSPPRLSPPRRPISPARRPVSPVRRPMSPPRRPVSPAFRQHSSRNVAGGRQASPPRRHNSPPRRPISPHNYRGSPPRQAAASRQKSPPPRRYADEWDIPSRGAAESGWNKQEKEKTGWQQGPPTSSSSWNQRLAQSLKRIFSIIFIEFKFITVSIPI